MLYQISWSIYPEHKVACNKIFASMNEEDDKKDSKEENVSKELFEQEANEEEDFEIPAFLRRQKF